MRLLYYRGYEIISKINLTNEQYIDLIKTDYKTTMNQVIQFEKSCRDHAAKTSPFPTDIIKHTTNSLIKWNKVLGIPDFSKNSQ